MELDEQLQELQSIHQAGNDKIFTMYLNTDPADPDQQGGKWKIQLKNGLRNIATYLDEDDDKEELEYFKIVKEKVEYYVEEAAQDLSRGMIVFASADDVWFAQKVQMRLETAFYWESVPRLEQLQSLIEKFPETGTILVQQNEIKIIEAYLNEIEATYHYELHLDTEDWKEKVGPRKGTGGMHPGATNLQKDNFAKKFSANQQRWYKSIAPKLDKMASDHHWDKIFLIGERDAVHELKKQMNKDIDHIVYKNMLHHEESEVLQKVSG